MKVTRKDIANYRLLGILLEKDKRKLERYIEKRPSCYSGKVYGFRMRQEDLLFLVALIMNRSK